MSADNDTTRLIEELERRVQAGDQEALASFFESLRPRLVRIVEAHLDPNLTGRVDPADILQDVFLDLTKKLPGFAARETPMRPLIWIRLVAKERVLITHRKHLFAAARDARREVTPAARTDGSVSNVFHHCLVSRVSTIGGRLMREEMSSALLKAIESLHEQDREIITMRIFEELSNSEAAEVVGLSENGASSRFVRAMMRLKKAVANIPEVNDYLTTILR
ncbi:MAG: sigma-70 family RNA polymerase sigma factor [Planctomycetota bacterium]